MKKTEAAPKGLPVYHADITASLAHTLKLQESRAKTRHDWLNWFTIIDSEEMLYESKMPYPSSIKIDTEDGARLLYELATDAVLALTELHRSNPVLFRKLARGKNVLPCLLSIHPDSLKMAKKMHDFSKLGTESALSLHVSDWTRTFFATWRARSRVLLPAFPHFVFFVSTSCNS